MARRLARMERVDFDDLLAKRMVPWDFSPEDILHDAEAAGAAASHSPAAESTER